MWLKNKTVVISRTNQTTLKLIAKKLNLETPLVYVTFLGRIISLIDK